MTIAAHRPDRWRQAFRVAGWLGVAGILVLSLVPGHERPHTGMPGQYEHVVAYAMVGAAFGLGYRDRGGRAALTAVLIGLASLLEIAQIWVPGRNAQIVDAAAGSLGAVIGMTSAAAILAVTRR